MTARRYAASCEKSIRSDSAHPRAFWHRHRRGSPGHVIRGPWNGIPEMGAGGTGAALDANFHAVVALKITFQIPVVFNTPPPARAGSGGAMAIMEYTVGFGGTAGAGSA